MLAAIVIIICFILCYSMARTMFRDHYGLKKAYCCGFPIGCATIAGWWALFALPVLIWYLYSPMKINNGRIFYSATLGALTPLWIMLPYWLFL